MKELAKLLEKNPDIEIKISYSNLCALKFEITHKSYRLKSVRFISTKQIDLSNFDIVAVEIEDAITAIGLRAGVPA